MEKVIINGRKFCSNINECNDNCPLFEINPHGCPIVLPGGCEYDVEITLVPRETKDTMQIWRGQQ